MATSTPVPTVSSTQAANAAFATLPSGSVYSGSSRIDPNDASLNNSLFLANGMTAGYGDNDGNYTNPLPFPGTYGGNPNWAPNRVGFIRNAPGSLPASSAADIASGVSPIYALYFIFNPNQIVASFALNSAMIPPLYLYGAGGSDITSTNNQILSGSGGAGSAATATTAPTVPNLTNSQSVSWSLIFDRTYDMLYDTNPGENRGVLKDVAALYNIMATFDTIGATPLSTPVQVVFGQTTSGQIWGFTGYISSVNITYGIFRANMIPSRCEVDLQMTTTYVSSSLPSTTPASSSVTSGGATTPAGTPVNPGASVGVNVGAGDSLHG